MSGYKCVPKIWLIRYTHAHTHARTQKSLWYAAQETFIIIIIIIIIIISDEVSVQVPLTSSSFSLLRGGIF